MAAPKNNTNAEKWTLEEASSFCDDVLSILECNENIRTLGKACIDAGGYEALTSYFEGKFGIVFESIKKAKEIAKERLINQGLENQVNPTMAIFILKNNHQMTDKQQIETKDVTENAVKIQFVKTNDKI